MQHTLVLIMAAEREMDSRAHWSVRSPKERSFWLLQENQAPAAHNYPPWMFLL